MTLNAPVSSPSQLRWLAITWLNHIGTTLVNVVPMSHLEQAVSVGMGSSPVADAVGSDGSQGLLEVILRASTPSVLSSPAA